MTTRWAAGFRSKARRPLTPQSDVLDWAEKAGLENIRYHLQASEAISKEATATLTVLLAASSGAFAYAVRADANALAASVLTAYLFLISAVLVLRCLMIGVVPAPTNEPSNLAQEQFDLVELRRVELRNLQQRINEIVRRNTRTARWLNGVRLAALCSPLIYAATTFGVMARYPSGRAVAAESPVLDAAAAADLVAPFVYSENIQHVIRWGEPWLLSAS